MWRLILFLAVLISPFCSWAQASLRASLSQNQTAINQPVELRYRVENAKFINFPAIKLADFDVMGPATMMSQTIINGQVSSSEVYTFVLYPRRVGKFTIPALTVKTNTNQTLTAPALSLQVSKQASQPQGEILLVTEVSNANPVVGEQLIIDLKLYTQTNLEGLKIARLPSSDNILLQEMRGFNNDWKETTYKGKKYFAASIYRAVGFATQAGKILIDGAMVQVGVLEKTADNNFSSFAQIVPVVLNAEPVELTVQGLDTPPEYFKAAVGTYQMLAYVDKNNISTDDALRLYVRINGEGDIKQVFAPALLDKDTAFECFAPTFKEKIVVSNRAVGGTKTFEFVLNPLQMGSFALTPVFVYYDNEKRQFVRKDTTFIINVVQGKNILLQKIDRPEPQISSDTIDLQPLQTSTVLTQTVPFSLLGSGYFYLMLVVSYLFVPVWRYYQQQKTKSSHFVPHANLIAQQYLAQARALLHKEQKNTPFYQAIEQGLQLYVAYKLALPAADISKNTIENLLAQKAVSPQLISQLLTLLDICYLAIYANVYPQNSPDAIKQQAENLIVELEKCL